MHFLKNENVSTNDQGTGKHRDDGSITINSMSASTVSPQISILEHNTTILQQNTGLKEHTQKEHTRQKRSIHK